MSTGKEYRLRYAAHGSYTNWMPFTGMDSTEVNLLLFNEIQFRDAPVACTAMAPFEIEEIGRPRCERKDASGCREVGTHFFDLEIEDGGLYNDCYHSRQITWSAL